MIVFCEKDEEKIFGLLFDFYKTVGISCDRINSEKDANRLRTNTNR